MKKFKSVILALTVVMGIGMVKPLEAYAVPTRTIYRSWLRHPNGRTGEYVNFGVRYNPLLHIESGRVDVADFNSGVHVGSIHHTNLEKNHRVIKGVNFRWWYTMNDNIIGFIPKGTELLATDNDGNRSFAGVRYNGRIGYVGRSYITHLPQLMPS